MFERVANQSCDISNRSQLDHGFDDELDHPHIVGLKASRPSSPTKPGQPLGYQPNPHPYAIKTISTGIPSRSATTSTSISHSHNHYVPLVPTPSPKKPSFSHSERGSRHRYSRSLTDDSSPRPLPPPPDDITFPSRRSRGRAETLPTFDSANPKQWSSAQLAAKFPDY